MRPVSPRYGFSGADCNDGVLGLARRVETSRTLGKSSLDNVISGRLLTRKGVKNLEVSSPQVAVRSPLA